MDIFILLIAFSLSLIYLIIKKKHNYWKLKGVKGPKPVPLIGNFLDVLSLKISPHAYVNILHDQYPKEKFVGLYRGLSPVLLVRDPEIIKKILIQDFNVFTDTGIPYFPTFQSNNLPATQGDTWRILRSLLTPLFTPNKLKQMVPLIRQCVENNISYVKNITENGIKEYEMKSITSKFALDIIGSCAFGIDLEVYEKKENEFLNMATDLAYSTRLRQILYVLEFLIPIGKINKKFKSSDSQFEFFRKLVSKVIKIRKDEPSERKDFMDLMIELKKEGKAKKQTDTSTMQIKIDDAMITGQALLFFVAGFEAISSSLATMLYELALNPNAQTRLYNEICTVSDKYNGVLNYEALADMTYFNMVFYETVRKNANPFYIARMAGTDYKLPEEDLVIEKGTLILISYGGVNKNSEYWENPHIFNPDNFASENRSKKPQCAEVIFSAGPRNCLGSRFAELQNMLYMAEFLKNFKVETCDKTVEKIEYDPKYICMTKHGIWLNIVRREIST